jgi:hypothetical protein
MTGCNYNCILLYLFLLVVLVAIVEIDLRHPLNAALRQPLRLLSQWGPTQKTNKLHGLSPRANYTDRATAACRQSDCQLVRIKGAMWSA